jgi:hypothetical protein
MRMSSVLLMLRHWGFALTHLNLHRAWQKQLLRGLNLTCLVHRYACAWIARGLVITLASWNHRVCIRFLHYWLLNRVHSSRLVCVVKLVSILTIYSNMLVIAWAHNRSRAFNCWSPVALLCVQLLSITSLSVDRVKANNISANPITVLIWNKGVSSGVVSKVCLIHKLLIEGAIDWDVVSCRTRWPGLLSFKKFCENQFLLVCHTVHIDTLSLYCSAKILETVIRNCLTKRCLFFFSSTHWRLTAHWKHGVKCDPLQRPKWLP